jgi:hypothetical protein
MKKTKRTMLHSKFPYGINIIHNSKFISASALAILLLSFTSSFAGQETIEDSASTGIDTASVSWSDSPVFGDSVDIVTTVKISNPDPEEIIEVRYGTMAGSGDLLAMNLRIVTEGQAYFLVYNDLKFPVDNNGFVTISARAEKAYLQQHDRYFVLKLKDESGNELRTISQTENH